MKKIISGKERYVFQKTREWAKQGYFATGFPTKWSDGTITVTLEKKDTDQ